MKRWQRMALVVAAVGALPLLSCGQRSLVLLDVRASTAFTNPTVLQDVRLTVVANREVTTRYPRIRLTTSSSYQIGMYLPSDMTGTVSFEATIDDGACIIGAGTAVANGVQSGETTTAIPIIIDPTMDCGNVDGGTAGTGGAGTAGVGGMTGGAGTTGSGGSSAGTGGTAGTGATAGSSGTVGSAGTTGTAGRGGTTGTAGVTGSAGTTGTAGRGGTTGTAGIGGTTGTAGIGGTTGTAGRGGTTGTAGIGGTTGTAGRGGTTGAGGVAGVSGVAGTTGVGGGGPGVGGVGGGGPGIGGSGVAGTTGTGGLGVAGTGGGGVCSGGTVGCLPPWMCDPTGTGCICSETPAQACLRAGLACGYVIDNCGQQQFCACKIVGTICDTQTNKCMAGCITGTGGIVTTDIICPADPTQ